MTISFGNNLLNKRTEYVVEYLKPNTESFIELEDLFIGKKNGGWIAYSRVCDHNGGVLNLDENKNTATCPIHKWTLKLTEGKYENNCPKIPYKVIENKDNLSIIKFKEEFPKVITENLIDTNIEVDFNAHASITLEVDSIKLTSDPWFIGSCFATGWWHINPPSDEAIQRLKDSNFIYISHNHPDHLHIPTLEKYVRKDTQIIVPNFESKSVESLLIKNGYRNLIITDFMKELDIHTANGKFRLIIVKSGDERDDSSLIVFTRENKIFLGVDTNMPNKWILPKVDLLFTPFASGASGFPSMIDNFSNSEKIKIIQNNRLSILNNHVKKLIAATNPKYVVPYAGYFTEAPRDDEVKKVNIKNSPDELISFVETEFSNIRGINPLTNSNISLYKDEIILGSKNELPAYFIDEEYIDEEISNFSPKNPIITDEYLQRLGDQFLKSSFCENLTIVILPSSSNFDRLASKALVINFSKSNRTSYLMECENSNEEIINKIAPKFLNKIELLRIRDSSMIGAFSQGLPFEDLSIGFQVKMFRAPNIYNFSFWDHFTNKEFIQLPPP